MLEILKRVHEEDIKNMEALASDDEIDNDELEEELDSDDDNDVIWIHVNTVNKQYLSFISAQTTVFFRYQI